MLRLEVSAVRLRQASSTQLADDSTQTVGGGG
jgi:hypothetical protein